MNHNSNIFLRNLNSRVEIVCCFHLTRFKNHSSLIVSMPSSSCCSEISKVSRPTVSSFSRSLVSWIWASATWTLPTASFAWSERVLISYFLSLMVRTLWSWLDGDMIASFWVNSVTFAESRRFFNMVCHSSLTIGSNHLSSLLVFDRWGNAIPKNDQF